METNRQNHYEEEISLAEIISILWKRKKMIIALPIIAALIAYAGSQFLTPSYSSTVKLSLGNLGKTMYTNPDAAEQVLRSRDLLRTVIDDLQLPYERSAHLNNTITVTKLPGDLLELKVAYNEPEMAQTIAFKIVEEFIKKAEPAYVEKLNLMEEHYNKTLQQYEKVGETLKTNKEALTKIETNPTLTNAEKDLSRARLMVLSIILCK